MCTSAKILEDNKEILDKIEEKKVGYQIIFSIIVLNCNFKMHQNSIFQEMAMPLRVFFSFRKKGVLDNISYSFQGGIMISQNSS